MSIWDQTPIPFPSMAEVDRFLAISTPPPSPLTSYSSPLPQIPSSPLPVSSPLHVSPPPLPASPTYLLGYIAAMIRLRAESPSTSHPLPLVVKFTTAPTTRPTREFKRDYSFVTTLDDEIRRDLERDVGYEIIDTWDDMVKDMQRTPIMTDVTELNMLHRDRLAHARTTRLMESEARLSREAWVQSIDASDTARSEVRALWTTVLAQQTKIRDLQAIDRRRQTQLTKALTLLRTLQTLMANHQINTSHNNHPTTFVIDEKLKRLIDQGVTDALAARDANRSQNGKDIHDSGTGVTRQAPIAHECIYPDFMKCKPLYFKGTEGVVELTSSLKEWKLALTCGTPHFKNVGHESLLIGNTWINQKRNGRQVLPQGGKVKKLEGCDVELKLKSHQDEKYVCGLPDMVYESVMASNPKTMQDAIEFTIKLVDKKIRTFAERQSKNKRKQDDNQQQQQNKRSTVNANTANNQRGTRAGQKPTCFEYGAQGIFKGEFPKLKNNNRGNQGGNGNAPAKVYAVGRAGTNPDSNVVTLTGETRLVNIISCIKTQKSLLKGCLIFLAHVTTKETEDKSEEKRLEDVPIIRDFPEVFPEDLPGFPLTRQVEFQIDLIPGVAPVSTGTLSIGPVQNERIVRPIKGAV
ncbi:hypothetical protein Tco_0726830 [Tanacetum coccineum]|uniref:Reverse transcriptase domain-containing protein n=1 Tax=Tanacetum coccineum TaxID=301880 RepID=A0ABQ4YGN7_9ASTR